MSANDHYQVSAIGRADWWQPLGEVIPLAKGVTSPGAQLLCFANIMLLGSHAVVQLPSAQAASAFRGDSFARRWSPQAAGMVYGRGLVAE